MKYKSNLFYGYLVFLVLYISFTLLPAPSPAILRQYHLTAAHLRLIDTTIIVLVAAIWYAGFYGYAKLRTYAQLIKGSKESRPINKLSNGIFLLVMWLPVSSVISAILNYLVLHHPTWLAATAVANHYIGLILPLSGFVVISLAARDLAKLVRQGTSYRAVNLGAILVIYIGLIYYHLVASTFHRAAVYHLSLWLILLTVVAPYIYMWSIGLLAAYDIYLYRLKVAGIIYRKSWGLLALGIVWLIITSIIFQYVTTLTGRLSHWSLGALLALVYALLLILSAGFIMIALGTRKLQKIEEA